MSGFRPARARPRPDRSRERYNRAGPSSAQSLTVPSRSTCSGFALSRCRIRSCAGSVAAKRSIPCSMSSAEMFGNGPQVGADDADVVPLAAVGHDALPDVFFVLDRGARRRRRRCRSGSRARGIRRARAAPGPRRGSSRRWLRSGAGRVSRGARLGSRWRVGGSGPRGAQRTSEPRPCLLGGGHRSPHARR